MLDPIALARAQLESDRRRTQALPSLLPRKLGRMSASPHGFLRGAAPFFYAALRDSRELGEGPGGEALLVGDLHLENFGAFRTDALGDADPARVVFDLNDFDEALPGPIRLDVLRLCTSLLLAAPSFGADGKRGIALAERLLEAHAAASCGQPPPPPPKAIEKMVSTVEKRTRQELLDRRTVVAGGERRFLRDPERYLEVAPEVAAQARLAFARYVDGLPAHERAHAEAFEPIDVAFRIAGTGSLGVLRLAVLTRGKGGKNGAWVFDLKEAGAPSAAGFLPAPAGDPAERVAQAMKRALAHPPRMVGTTRLGEVPMLARRLSPQEDKLSLEKVDAGELPAVVAHLGALAGAAHRRTAAGALPAWDAGDRAALLERAIRLAGLHQAGFLAYAREAAVFTA